MRTTVALIAVGAVMLLGACGDDDEPAAEDTMPVMQTTVPAITTTVPPPSTQPRFYEIKSGDTLSAIASSFGLPVQAIMDANGITDPNLIVAGQVITLPLAEGLPTTTVAPELTTVPPPTAEPVLTTLAP